MVNYQSTLAHQFSKITEPGYWYKSPLRDEKSASLNVDLSLNRWFEFGEVLRCFIPAILKGKHYRSQANCFHKPVSSVLLSLPV